MRSTISRDIPLSSVPTDHIALATQSSRDGATRDTGGVRGGRGGGRGGDRGSRGRGSGCGQPPPLQQSSQTPRTGWFCTHCGLSGHTKETCWDLVGYPRYAHESFISEPSTSTPMLTGSTQERSLVLLEEEYAQVLQSRAS